VAEFVIRIPRSSPDATEATLVEKLVAEGSTVNEGEPLFLIATDKVEIEIESGGTGVVHWDADEEVDYEIGAEIGTITTTD
jgi:pyruvate/2-oxoglutarate dehydrogenase complex dihydrolipoamide acyltransferase (E2) component